MNYSQAIQYLFGLEKFGWKLGLERMNALLAEFGNPQQSFKSLHVAGTNGKGSVSAMLSSILSASGYKTGLYTSPHLVDARERIQINGEHISEENFLSIIVELKPFLDKHGCTFFEAMTALAFCHFSRMNVDVTVVEVGLGGRLDATNVIEPLLSIITNIGYDHTEHLGKELPEIASEKAGILKPGIPCVVGELPDSALERIKEIANQSGSPLFFPQEEYSILKEIPTQTSFSLDSIKDVQFELSLAGKHMLKNALIAITAARQLESKLDHISPENIAIGLSNVNWPGRFQTVSKKPTIIFDVAHNYESMYELVVMLKQFFPQKNIVFLFGLLKDKNVEKITSLLATIANRCYVAEPDSDRAQSAKVIRAKLRELGVKTKVFPSISSGFKEAIKELGVDEVLCITGSHYVVGEIIPKIKSLTHKYIINKL